MKIALFAGCLDLACKRLGGRVLQANDEFFAAKENLIEDLPPTASPGRFTEQGQWMDGWETRRRRSPGHDWCILQLGLAGELEGADIDTSHFLGNQPPYGSLEGGLAGPGELPEEWRLLLPRSPLRPDTHNVFALRPAGRLTHVRFCIYPDGGVARLRLYGRPRPDPVFFDSAQTIDLAALENGARAVACSDMFFSPMDHLLQPGPSLNMGDGWETRRRRGAGHDWVVVRLARPGTLRKITIETSHYKGNAPAECRLEGTLAEGEIDGINCDEASWISVLDRSHLEPDHLHDFQDQLQAQGPFSHLRLSIYPDGGIARLRVWGHASRPSQNREPE